MTTWIFQGNPDDFKVDEYLTRQKIIRWQIRQKHLREKFAVGDVVYIWRSNGKKRPKSGGIVARGRTVSPPQTENIGYHTLWIHPPERPIELWIEIAVDEVRLTEAEGMLLRTDLLEDENLADLRILRVPNETNYELTDRQAREIERLWAR